MLEEEERLKEGEKNKKTGPYTPSRLLPKDKDGVKLPDADAPHTQLGTRKGEDGIYYPQARGFDEYGREVRDVDFTDHGRPHEHPNPHQHRYEENPTGGTRTRSTEAEPGSGWSYL